MSALAKFITLREWIESGQGAPAFERYDQMAWFLRSHRDELIQSGTFIPGRGNRPTLVTPHFGNILARILKREARHAGAPAVASDVGGEV